MTELKYGHLGRPQSNMTEYSDKRKLVLKDIDAPGEEDRKT
jgi:hypothetical protein